MTNKLIRVLSVATLMALAVASWAQISWTTDYKAAVAQAKKSGKLVMASFYTNWDQYGKRLEAETYANPEVVALSSKFIPVKLNVEANGAAQASKFKVVNYPTVLFIDPNENVVGTIDGFEAADDFVKHATAFQKHYADFPKVSARAKANSKDLDAITQLGLIYSDRYQMNMAEPLLKRAEAIDPTNKSDKITDLYNSIGDYYQTNSKFTVAIPYFEKAARTSKVTDKRAYGYLSIASCYFSMKQYSKAMPSLEACLKLPNLGADDRDLAEQYREISRRLKDGTELPGGGGN